MDDIEDDARYPQNPYGENNQQSYVSNRHKLPVGNATYSRPVDNQYAVGEDEDSDDEEEGEHELGEEAGENNQTNGIHYAGKDVDVEEEEDEEAVGDDEDEDEDEDEIPPVAALAVPKPSVGGRNPLTDWTERETFVLLDAWGEKFLQRGKKSLRSDEWQEVAEKVSDKSKIERTDTQCRNRLDTLKKKYKIERIKLAEDGGASKWVYFKKMDILMSTSAQQGGLSCGLDSGEYVSMNPKVYSNHSNGLDEMRDSPGNSELARDEDDSDGLPPKKRRLGRDCIGQSSFGLLADSIHKFSDIYEKIESSKRQQMLELEKMRMDFQRDLEMQKRQIIERAQAEIAKIHQVSEEEDSISANSA
ncbi:TRIHELIX TRANSCRIPTION FACTOR ASIL2 [Salix viminalis]|uniref:TRIHELIX TRANSCRIPTION FACTOR ASIL2 n=1 Tax=Salix viminalis TaxID=40686 RepID=A0A9Q0TP12_SALVM|nr:TRIHELIX TRANSCRIPTION FACTOR ASIL2 [Salix viminalis]